MSDTIPSPPPDGCDTEPSPEYLVEESKLLEMLDSISVEEFEQWQREFER